MSSQDILKDIVRLEEEISSMKAKNRSAIFLREKELNELGYIDSFKGITLYSDRIEGDGRVISLGSNVDANISESGSISYTTETKGGGSRPTLTRITAGALVAGPVGAIIGATAQKQKKTKTITHQHDDRTATITISSKDGNISRTWNGDAAAGRSFATKIMNSVADYPKNKKFLESERKRIQGEIENIKKDSGIAEKEKELNGLLSQVPDKDRKNFEKANDSIKIALAAGIISIFTCFIPYLGVIAPIVAIFFAFKMKKIGVKGKKIIAALILGAIFLILSVIFTVVFTATYDPGSYSSKKTTDDSSEPQESSSIEIEDFSGKGALPAYNKLKNDGFNVKFVFDRTNNGGFSDEDFQSFVISSFNSSQYSEMPFVITRQESYGKDVTLYIDYLDVVNSNNKQIQRESNLESRLSIVSAMSACDLYGQAHYKNFKLHGVLGKIAEYASDDNTWFLKYYVDANGYSNKNMECYVSGTTNSPAVTKFVIY